MSLAKYDDTLDPPDDPRVYCGVCAMEVYSGYGIEVGDELYCEACAKEMGEL